MDKFVFGITGPTGAGKSTVSNIFRRFGVYVCDADIVARAVMKKGGKCLDEIIVAFGETVLTPQKELDRRALAEIVFSDDDKLKLLNTITHKYIKEQIEIEIEKAPSELVAIDGAVIIGSPVMKLCKKLVVVTANEKKRIDRIIKRDGISRGLASKRINSQMTNAEYESFADFIIQNNDNDVRLEECVEDIYNKIKNISKAV
ncbi:MAG: dephospho-CoA kinase [Clostridia bacterium]|nr:dephospho-CoA kinase [Clostridia bacterium]